MPADVDVAVIGGGLAGIAAALAARKAGADVVVLEADTNAGGKAQTLDALERGPHSFNGRHTVFWELLDALQLSHAAVPLPATSKYRYLARGGALHALAPSPLTMLGTGALTFREKLSLLFDALFRRALAPAATVHDFFSQRLGTSFAEGPAAAMISGIFAGDPRQLSMAACFPELLSSAKQERSFVRGMLALPKTGRRGLFTLEGGLGRIGQAAREQLHFETSSPVREVLRDSSGFWVHSRQNWHARAVVVATEAPAAAKLMWPVSPKLGAALGQLKYVPLSVVHWQGDLTKLPAGFGYLACPSEGLFALGTIFEGATFSTFVRGVDASDEALAAGIAGDVAKLTGGAFGTVLRVDRWPHAVFQPTVDVLSVRDSLAPLATEAGVSLAGSYLGSSAMKDALASGFIAGQAAAEASQRVQAWSRSLS